MESASAVTPPPAARLSEEAMDLVCSFVREEENDRVMAETLCALALVSRRWTSSAIRALWHDPSRSISRSSTLGPLELLKQLLKKPHAGRFVKALDRLPEAQSAFFPDVDIKAVHILQAETWTLSFIKHCASIRSLAISPDFDLNWREELQRFKHLQHLSVRPKSVDNLSDRHEVLFEFLSTLDLGLASSLSIEQCSFHPPRPPLQIKATRFELLDYWWDEEQDEKLPVELHGVEHLALSPFWPFSSGYLHLLLPSLRSFSFTAQCDNPHPPLNFPDDVSAYDAMVQQWPFPFSPFPRLPHLEYLSLKHLYLDLPDLEEIVTSCSKLQILDLNGSVWQPAPWIEQPPKRPTSVLLFAISSLSSLNTLNLGWVPIRYDSSLGKVKELVTQRKLKFSFRNALHLPLRPGRKVALNSVWESLKYLLMGGGSDDESASSDSADSSFPSPAQPTASPPPPSAHSPSGSLDAPSPRLDDSCRAEITVDPPDPFDVFKRVTSEGDKQDDETFHSGASFSTDDETNAAADGKYVAAFPDEPRFEEDYQAEDLVDDEEVEEKGEAWRNWEGLDDLEQADEAWSTFELYPEAGELEWSSAGCS